MANTKRDPLRNRWVHMWEKCTKEYSRQYKDFGGRGITICEEWKDFEKFKEWSLANGYSNDLELGRINQNGNFEPSNCRYVTSKQQASNRRTCNIQTYRGDKLSIIELCRKYNKNYNVVRKAIGTGKSIEEAMSTTKPFVEPPYRKK